MPTPSDDTLQFSSLHNERLVYATCPLENERSEAWRTHDGQGHRQPGLSGHQFSQRAVPSLENVEMSGSVDDSKDRCSQSKIDNRKQVFPAVDASSPTTIQEEAKKARGSLSPSPGPFARAIANPSTSSYEFSSIRQIPSYTSSFLRAGSKFRGTQTSDKQTYNVEVDIKHVDMNESFLCGYLRIEGLAEDHPTLTTYFEGEIVGPKYTFQTKHESWGATDKTDMQHWARFPAWRPLAKQAKKPEFHYKNCAQRENIFMRWKEYFLVPDHRVREIIGASFEGFYYICFNQVAGTVSGIYFHAKSEKYQKLELSHVETMGCYASMEFR